MVWYDIDRQTDRWRIDREPLQINTRSASQHIHTTYIPHAPTARPPPARLSLRAWFACATDLSVGPFCSLIGLVCLAAFPCLLVGNGKTPTAQLSGRPSHTRTRQHNTHTHTLRHQHKQTSTPYARKVLLMWVGVTVRPHYSVPVSA